MANPKPGQHLPSGTVTFLFTDIEGSTRLAREHAERWESLRAQHHEILHAGIESNRGFVFQIIGDAFCAAFHTAGDALRAAAKSQIALQSENWGDAPVRVRMGIHTGKAEVQENGEYHGYLAMSRIQRLMSAGHGGQVLISAVTQELLLEDVPEEISLRDLGERRLKDLNRPEHIYQLVIPNLPVDFPPLKTLDTYRHNLPVQLTSFIGREKEIEEIKRAISRYRLVTLTGVGGTGKTRLALQVAADMLDVFSDGVWLVELASLTDPDLISQTILTALGIPEQAGITDLELLMDYLRGKNILLLLDNCEHLIDACAKLAERLVNHALVLRILTTSREALGLHGELIWQVPSLSLPDVKGLPAIEQFSQYEAVQLFVERARLVQPQFLVTNENAPAVAQICTRLDGIPLAIELAAARVRAISVDQISKRLDDRFRLLTGGSRTALERHQTLRATIAWSYNLLSRDEKLLLCRLSVFAGGWSLEAAEQVCVRREDEFDVLDLLTHLVDKSLVNLDGSRYRMLETTRQFAREKLLDSDEGATLYENHLAYFLNLAEQGDKQIYGPDQVEWMDRLELDFANFRSAIEWCLSERNTEAVLRLLCAQVRVWTLRGYVGEMKNWIERIRAQPDATNYPALYARLLNFVGNNSRLEGNTLFARSVLEESRAMWLRLGVEGELGLAETLDYLGEITVFDDQNIEMAQSLFEQSLKLYQRQGDQRGMAWIVFNMGNIAYIQGRYTETEQLYKKSLAKFQELGDKFKVAYILQCLGEVDRCRGDYEQAGKHYRQNLEIFQELRGRFAVAYPLLGLAWVSLHTSDYEKAKTMLLESLKLSNESNTRDNIMLCLTGFAGLLGMTGKPKQAARILGAAEFSLESLGRLEPADQKEYDHYTEVVRRQLDAVAFEEAWTKGRAMSMEQAIEYVLEEIDE